MSAMEHYEVAMQAWRDEQPEVAIAELTRAIALEPQLKVAVFDLACLYGAINRYEEALENFQRIIRQYPEDAATYKYIGKLFRQKAQASNNPEDWKSAQEALEQSLFLDSNDADTFDELALVLYEQGSFDQAMQSSFMAAALAPKDRRIAYNLDATAGRILRKYLTSGRWRKAWQFWVQSWKQWKHQK